MRKLIMWNVMSLDGYFEGEKSWDLSFHQHVWGKEIEEFSIEQLQSADLIVYGKATYLGMAEYWTGAEGEIAGYVNGIEKVVCSTSLETAEWNNTRIVRDAVAEIPALKEQATETCSCSEVVTFLSP